MSRGERIARTERPIGPRAILLVRLSAIGDIVFASPLIGALRRAYPHARIAWLVQPEYRGLLDRHPDLDEVITCPLGQWRSLWRERRLGELGSSVRTLRGVLRERRFDLAIDLQGLLKSGTLAWLTGAPRRIGLGSREGSRWLMTETLPRGGNPRLIGSEYLYLAERLGLPTDAFAMAVHYDEDEAAFADRLIADRGLAAGFAALCPFTTRPQKHWLEERWEALAARIAADLDLTPVLLGGAGDRAAARRILAAGSTRVVDLVGGTSLTQAAALIDRASLLVGVDTGLGHMGVALGTPSLLLFGSTCPYLETGRANTRVLYHPLTCSPCKRRPTCDGAFTCMRLIEVDEVIGAARSALGRPP